MKCADCARSSHLGKKCSGVSENTFKGMSASKHEKWCCLECRGGLAKSNLDSNPTTSSQSDPCSFLSELAEVNKKLDLLLSWKDTVDTIHDLHPKVDALLSMKQVVDTMQDSLNALQESVNFVSAQYDSLVTTAKSQDHTIKAMQLELSALRSSTAEQALEIHRLKSYQNDKEQVDRLSNMEIHGIPLKTQENIRDIMSDLAEKIEVEDFQAGHVMSAHRLPARPARPAAIPPIMVRFSSVALKERWMSCRGKLGSLPSDGSHPRIYFNDNLTDSNRKLFWMARTRGKEKNFKFIWVRHGKIFAKQSQGSTTLHITNTEALELIT